MGNLRKDLFLRLKIALNELEYIYQPEKFFKMSNKKLQYKVEKYEDLVENLEEYSDYSMYRAM